MVMFKTSNLRFHIASSGRLVWRDRRPPTTSRAWPHHQLWRHQSYEITAGHWAQRLIVRSVTVRHDCSNDRSMTVLIYRKFGSRWLPLVARLLTIALATDLLKSLVIARTHNQSCNDLPPAKDQSQYSIALWNRNKHCRSDALWPHRSRSYDSEIVRSSMNGASLYRL